jgi:hypothetical protein
MDTTAIRRYLADQDRAISHVLSQLVAKHGCPCHSPQFEYWVSKPQGPGWQDGLQNELVSAALKLKCFSRRKPETPRYGLEAIITCARCGREWQYFSEEWRMLAFHDRLIPLQPSAPVDSDPLRVGPNVFATAGQEPTAVHTLGLEEWKKFMIGTSADELRGRGSLVDGLIGWFKRRS